MLDVLKRDRDEFSYTAVKAEFEDEGTQTDELLRTDGDNAESTDRPRAEDRRL
jgi:hypothetical protein